jgi:DNA-binding transcriptional MocR family regulator
VHPLAGITRQWAFVRSVAKAYGPDLRLAVLTGDRTTVDRVTGRHRLGPGWVSRVIQRAVVRLWADEALDTRSVAAAYGRRRDLLIEALAQRGIEAHGRSGLNVWIPVREEAPVMRALYERGWLVAAGERFRLRTPPGIRVTTAVLHDGEPAAIAEAIAQAERAGQPRRLY